MLRIYLQDLKQFKFELYSKVNIKIIRNLFGNLKAIWGKKRIISNTVCDHPTKTNV